MDVNQETEVYQKVSSEVKNTFFQIYNAVKERESQLLRQIDVIAQHCKINNSYEKCFKQISVIFDNEIEVLLSISKFGRINYSGLSHDSHFLKIEDYQHPDKDHVSLHKCVNENRDSQISPLKENNSKNKIENSTQEKNSHENEVSKEDMVSNVTKKNYEKQDLCVVESVDTQVSGESSNSTKKERKEKNVSHVSTSILECIQKQDPSLCLHESFDKRVTEAIETRKDKIEKRLSNSILECVQKQDVSLCTYDTGKQFEPNETRQISNSILENIQKQDFSTCTYESSEKRITEVNESKSEKILSSSILECIEKQDPSLCIHESGEKRTINEPNESLKTERKSQVANIILECIEKQDPSLCIHETVNQIHEVKETDISSCCSSPNDKRNISSYFDSNNISNSTSEPNLTCTCNIEYTPTINISNSGDNFRDKNVSDEFRNASERVRKISMKQPVQVQQWMKQIISEPETEPAPNNVMEHSQIKAFHKITS